MCWRNKENGMWAKLFKHPPGKVPASECLASASSAVKGECVVIRVLKDAKNVVDNILLLLSKDACGVKPIICFHKASTELKVTASLRTASEAPS